MSRERKILVFGFIMMLLFFLAQGAIAGTIMTLDFFVTTSLWLAIFVSVVGGVVWYKENKQSKREI